MAVRPLQGAIVVTVGGEFGYPFRVMTRRSRPLPWTYGALVGLVVGAASSPAAAQVRPALAQAAAVTEDQAKAQQHFQRAKELYAAGSYREAVGELEAARTLDPKAKDLVFNLGIVHEKLAQYDEAISDFRQYMEMEGVTTAEKQKAESIIKRIEGAKRTVPEAPPNGAAGTGQAGGRTTGPTPPGGDPGEERPAQRGRVDAATITAASVAVLGLGAGAAFGVAALTTRPSDFVTGRDGTYADLESKTKTAHTFAIVSDVGLGVGVLSAALAAYLYFGRTKDPERPRATAAPALLPGGGAFVVGGSFR